ncbi:DUF6771 family protein [Novosphingobium sp. LASN5T]|uniref:DUF6771 family protein n=1 Tax=Novosphingobium sp. LASN5T TaxID=2491021 RepID=UPI00351A1EBD
MLGGPPSPVNRDERLQQPPCKYVPPMFFCRHGTNRYVCCRSCDPGAPGWARVGITAPSSCLREDAALELARVIADAVDAPASAPSLEQSTLPL